MPAEAGIQSMVNLNRFKSLDSRLRGNDGGFPIATQFPRGEGKGAGKKTKKGNLSAEEGRAIYP
jgi:hypothetical protein